MRKLLFAPLLFAIVGCSRTPVRVRVQNDTGRDLSAVTIQAVPFGAIPAGGSSAYQKVIALDHNPTVLTREPNGYFRNHRIIQDPKGARNSGSFTVTLSLNAEENLQVQVRREE